MSDLDQLIDSATPARKTSGLKPTEGRLLPLGALVAGFGLLSLTPIAQAQGTTATPAPTAAAPSSAVPGSVATETQLQGITVKARAESDATSLRATTSTIGKGNQELRDIPQSVTVLTEKLLDDRRVDTLKDALHQTAGVTFQAAEGGEEDVRLRGFSLATSGDIYVDGLRDPAFYDRDVFSYDRVELLRGSASMLFGRGSTGGVVNQVQKQAFLADASQIEATVGSGHFLRVTGDFNIKTSDTSGLRINAMKTNGNSSGLQINKAGLALNYRLGIGSDDEFSISGYALHNNNDINYGIPWLRVSSAQTGNDPSTVIPGLDPSVYYGTPSDYNRGNASYGTLGWTHRFKGGGELKTSARQGYYDRDQRSGANRFCTAPTCPGFATPGLEGPVFATADTPLRRGDNNKVQDLHTTYLQSDYSNRFEGYGLSHELLSGFDLAHEQFKGYFAATPAGLVLDKNAVPITLGSPNNGSGWVDETLREKRPQGAFDAKAAGIYAQDLVQVADYWKVLAGLRYDYFKGGYQSIEARDGSIDPVGTITADRHRSDGLWSRRFGVLFQPTDSQSYHFSYGTSFNTSGDTYQYDLPGSNTPPESSRNLELGAKLDLLEGRVSTRFAIFKTVKYNERNRDSPNNTPIDDYLLSGRRHAAGIDMDIAGKITPQWEVFGSYAWIPIARIDAGNPDGSTLSGERVGQRPSLTPRHSGTVWTTYQITAALRLGAGVNFRSSQTPNRNPAGVVAPRWVTGDLLAEYTFNDSVSFRLNVLNVTDKFYADSLYTGHYVQGAARSVQATLSTRF